MSKTVVWETANDFRGGDFDYIQPVAPQDKLSLGKEESFYSGGKQSTKYDISKILAVLLRFGQPEAQPQELINEGIAPNATRDSGYLERKGGKSVLREGNLTVPYNESMALPDPREKGSRGKFAFQMRFMYEDPDSQDFLIQRSNRFSIDKNGSEILLSIWEHIHEVKDEGIVFSETGSGNTVRVQNANLSPETVKVTSGKYPDEGEVYERGTDYDFNQYTGEFWIFDSGAIHTEQKVYADYYYDEETRTRTFSLGEVVKKDKWHNLFFRVKDDNVDIFFDDSRIYHGSSWYPQGSNYLYNHEDPESDLQVSNVEYLDSLYLFGADANKVNRRFTGEWTSEVLELGTPNEGEYHYLKYLQVQLEQDSYDVVGSTVKVEIIFSKDVSEVDLIEAKPSYSWFMVKPQETFFPPQDHLLYGNYAIVKVFMRRESFNETIPNLDKITAKFGEMPKQASPPDYVLVENEAGYTS